MNNTLYTDLAPLGFAEWYAKKQEIGTDIAYDDFEYADKTSVDSSIRTEINALAFRWMREEKKLHFWVRPFMGAENRQSVCLFDFNKKEPFNFGSYDTHELAEHHALNKALEIIKGGENGI